MSHSHGLLLPRMTTRPMFTPLASADIENAFSWYEEQRLGLGVHFADTLEALWGCSAGFPMPARKCIEGSGVYSFPRFPYAVYYRHDAGQIEIRAPDGYLR